MREYRGKPIRATAFGTDFVYGGKFEIGGKVYIVPEETGQIIEKVWDGQTIISRGRGYERATWDLLAGFIEVIPESVGQYIGLKDKEKDKIYKGDIYKIFDETKENKIYEILFKEGCFLAQARDGMKYHARTWAGDSCKIIGNTTDNPELLESEESK